MVKVVNAMRIGFNVCGFGGSFFHGLGTLLVYLLDENVSMI